jgi:translation initiation factor IF-2
VTIPKPYPVAELANRMARRSVRHHQVLMKNGHMATANEVIDADTASSSLPSKAIPSNVSPIRRA